MNKVLIAAAFFITMIIAGCGSDKEKQAAEQQRVQDSIRVADSISQSRRTAEINREAQKKKVMDWGDYFEPESKQFKDKVKAGKIIVLSDSNNAELTFKMEGSKVRAVSMPDGKLYQVKKEGDKTYVVLADGKKIERKEINGKIYLVSDDNTQYQVVMAGGRMLAVTPDNVQVALKKK